MPGSATLYLESAVLGHTLAFTPMVAPSGVFLALTTTPPSSTVGGIEVASGSYARMPATFALASPSNLAANALTVEFPAATAAWGTVGWFEIWDAQTAGNRLYWGPLVDPADGVTPITRTVMPGDIVRFSAGVVQVQAV